MKTQTAAARTPGVGAPAEGQLQVRRLPLPISKNERQLLALVHSEPAGNGAPNPVTRAAHAPGARPSPAAAGPTATRSYTCPSARACWSCVWRTDRSTPVGSLARSSAGRLASVEFAQGHRAEDRDVRPAPAGRHASPLFSIVGTGRAKTRVTVTGGGAYMHPLATAMNERVIVAVAHSNAAGPDLRRVSDAVRRTKVSEERTRGEAGTGPWGI